MASTNKTTNLQLPQWEAMDKPERVDFNDAMSKIDTTVGTLEGKVLTIYKSAAEEAANVTIDLGEIPSDSLSMIFMIYASVRQATTQWGEGLWMLYRSFTGTAYAKEVFARDITLNISTGSIVLSHSSANVRCLVGKIIRLG